MNFNFKKNIVVGVSVTPEMGLEVAQVDYATKTVLKYACKPLLYDNTKKEIADIDIFCETLLDMLQELQIPKGSEIVLDIPTVFFKVADFTASWNKNQIDFAIEDELASDSLFQNTDLCISSVCLPDSTIQYTKVAYTVAQKTLLIEIALKIKEMGYKLITIETSVNSALNALIYNNRVDVSPDMSWVFLLVDNNFCRIFLMLGQNYIDCYEEKLRIGEVLEESENYAAIINVAMPILKNIPSRCLYVVSTTSIISAKNLADKLTYSAPIIHQESNCYNTESFINTSPEVDEVFAKQISLNVIGAAINKEFSKKTTAKFNLYNASLGDVYILEQPPVIKIGNYELVLSVENMLVFSLIVAAVLFIITFLASLSLDKTIKENQAKLDKINSDIAEIERFLKENDDISADLFDEGDEIRIGLISNKNIYSYFTIVGTEIPEKLWLTRLDLGQNIIIEGQAGNLESVYSFFRSIKDYNLESNLQLQKLKVATNSNLVTLTEKEAFDTDSIITSMNSDSYEFRISNTTDTEISTETDAKTKKQNAQRRAMTPPKLEPLD